MINLDNACDIYKDMKENPNLYGIKKRMRIAESDYEYSLYNPPLRKEKNAFKEAKDLLERENL